MSDRSPQSSRGHASIAAGIALAVLLTAGGCASKPEHAAAHAVESLLDADQPQAAAEALEACLHQYPNSLELLRLRVIVLLRVDRLEPALTALQRLPAYDPVLGQALHHRNLIVRAAAARLIAEHALPVGCRDLARALEDSQPAVRRYCAEAAGRRRDCAALRPLFRLLYDDDQSVHVAAVTAFGNLGDPRAAGWLIPQLDVNDAAVHAAVEVALTKIAGPANRELLLGALRTATRRRQLGLALALAQLEEPSVLPLLVQTARQGAVEERPNATQALGNYANPVVTNALESLLTDPDPAVRQAADRAWQKLQTRQGNKSGSADGPAVCHCGCGYG